MSDLGGEARPDIVKPRGLASPRTEVTVGRHQSFVTEWANGLGADGKARDGPLAQWRTDSCQPHAPSLRRTDCLFGQQIGRMGEEECISP